MTKQFFGQQIFGSKKIFGQKDFWSKNFWVEKMFGSKKFLGHKNFWSKKFWIRVKKLRVKISWVKKDCPTHQKTVGLKLCWIVVRFVRWGHIQNFRQQGPLFLVEVEFLCGWWYEQQYSGQTQPNVEVALSCG